MMRLPEIKYSKKKGGAIRQQEIAFGGLDYTPGARSGALRECTNMSTRRYPVLSPRRGRDLFRDNGASSIFEWDGKLVQTPLPALEGLREAEIAPDGTLPPVCELTFNAPEGDFDLNLFTRADGSGGLRLHYDSARRVCTLDRSGMDKRFNRNVGEVLDMPLETPLRNLRVFIDRCSAELFANDGEATFTTHLYPTEGEFHYTLSAGTLRIWKLAASVTDEFIV